MIKKFLCASAALTFATTTPITAAPILLDFEFGGVSGTFYGLDDAVTTTQAATSYVVSGVLDTYTFATNSFTDPNAFTFTSTGELSAVSFLDTRLELGNSGSGILWGIQLDNNTGVLSEYLPISQSFVDTVAPNPVFTVSHVASVPLPAGGLLLLSGLAGVAGLKRRKTRTA